MERKDLKMIDTVVVGGLRQVFKEVNALKRANIPIPETIVTDILNIIEGNDGFHRTSGIQPNMSRMIDPQRLKRALEKPLRK